MFNDTIKILPGSNILLQRTEPGVAVIVLPPSTTSVDEALCGPPKLHAAISHDAGVTWPDNAGCWLANSAAEDGGVIALQFVDEEDAQACLRRLREENRP